MDVKPEDIEALRARGMQPEEVESQIERFRKGAPFLELVRPCTVGDGIVRLTADARERCLQVFEGRARGRRLVKFVPASGAASRMFRDLLKIREGVEPVRMDRVRALAEEGDGAARAGIQFMEGIRRFAFFGELRDRMAAGGLSIEERIEAGDFTDILDYLLTDRGLDYASLPKGLLLFHAYPEGPRTAFEEHLVEAEGYDRSGDGVCRLHFTVSEEHVSGFERCFSEAKPAFESAYGASCAVEFSFQDPSTDTIAVDLENEPFRTEEGGLLFRPGGHGALIRNLGGIDADLIFVKNIDNVAVDRLKPPAIRWKKILAGFLLDLQAKVFSRLDALKRGGPDERAAEEAAAFLRDELGVDVEAERKGLSGEAWRGRLVELLERPLRVCGMVENAGEPGGGPFWVKGKHGRISRQIVEKAQVDLEAASQQERWRSSTHFNPVDIVCATRGLDGRSFDLSRFVDPEAVIITRKSTGGKDLKALELPGLWNGGMAWWHTVFIEVPLVTFNPVKTVTDLLREAHQPSE